MVSPVSYNYGLTMLTTYLKSWRQTHSQEMNFNFLRPTVAFGGKWYKSFEKVPLFYSTVQFPYVIN